MAAPIHDLSAKSTLGNIVQLSDARNVAVQKLKEELSNKLTSLGKEGTFVQRRLCSFIDVASSTENVNDVISSEPGKEIAQALVRRLGSQSAEAFMKCLASSVQTHLQKDKTEAAPSESSNQAKHVLEEGHVVSESSTTAEASVSKDKHDVASDAVENIANSSSDLHLTPLVSALAQSLAEATVAVLEKVQGARAPQQELQPQNGCSLSKTSSDVDVDDALVKLTSRDGNTYYWNRRTGRCGWQLPNGVQAKWSGQKLKNGRTMYYDHDGTPVAKLPPLPLVTQTSIIDEALVKLTSRDGRIYFWDRRTGACRWELPSGVKAKWTGEKAKDGRTYYWSDEGKAVWKMPPLSGTKSSSSSQRSQRSESPEMPSFSASTEVPASASEVVPSMADDDDELGPFAPALLQWEASEDCNHSYGEHSGVECFAPPSRDVKATSKDQSRLPDELSICPGKIESHSVKEAVRERSVSLSPLPRKRPCKSSVQATTPRTKVEEQTCTEATPARDPLLTPATPAPGQTLTPASTIPNRYSDEKMPVTVFERRSLISVFEYCVERPRSRSPHREMSQGKVVASALDSDSMLDDFMAKVKSGAPPGNWNASDEKPNPYGKFEALRESGKKARRPSIGGA
eukprot:TRINITY_DN71751_c0_g1_i1.p1 TRINITY_DN71751_c0_g1~~TRINITY_DN71751_c0_g1_i1.p1  ORF type:complete len:627 (-),score=98.10 TRINITY_DN71751_c0_g1_i1:519-2399(-)